MEENKDIEYVNKANQRTVEVNQFIFTSCKGMVNLTYNNINLFRIRNYIEEKRWYSIINMKNASNPKSGDLLTIYECEDANQAKYVVAVFDPIELWDDPYTMLVEPM